MVKKFVFSFLSLLTFSNFGMQQPHQQLRPWVQAEQTINVRTPSKQLNAALPITHHSTVLDVKNSIQDREGIPVRQQSFYPLTSTSFGLKEEQGPELDDHENIKAVMNVYNSRKFLLILRLAQNGPNKG